MWAGFCGGGRRPNRARGCCELRRRAAILGPCRRHLVVFQAEAEAVRGRAGRDRRAQFAERAERLLVDAAAPAAVVPV